VSRLPWVIAALVLLGVVLAWMGVLGDVANAIVQIVRVVLDLFVRLINLLVDLLRSIG
jgi:hypothetical protein